MKDDFPFYEGTQWELSRLMMQRVMRNYCKNEEKPLWHTHKVLWEKGSGRSTLSGEKFGQTSSQQLNITVLVVLGVIIPK